MSGNTITLIINLLTLAVNYTNLFLTFPRRFGRLVSFGLPVVFHAVFQTALYVTNLQDSTFLSGWRGLINFPLILLLMKGQAFQVVFACFFQMMLSGIQLALASVIAGCLALPGSEEYKLFRLVTVAVMYAVYITLMALHGRRIFGPLFIDDRRGAWALYSLGAVLSFAAMTIANALHSPAYRVSLLLYVFWSFVILCFAVINTHEKTKQSYDAEFARGIVSSGREHYQKMDEMYDKLRILRHDYKYHLTTIGELLEDGKKDEIGRYLTDCQAQFSQIEMPLFCSNSVINALLASYAERCAGLGIEYEFDVLLPETNPIPNYEMCIVLGNLLENAVEACRQLENEKKIQLLLKPVEEALALRVRNGYNGKLNITGDEIRSTKKDGGFGLKSVEAVAVRYGGELLTDWTDNTFTAYVAVKLREPVFTD